VRSQRYRLALAALWLATSCGSFHDMRARGAYRKGDFESAETINAEALASDPNDLDARKLGAQIATKRGADALDKGDLKKAETYFRKATELNPADAIAADYLELVERELKRQSVNY
jgi:tetratricopeptide (TPR) repeat protein